MTSDARNRFWRALGFCLVLIAAAHLGDEIVWRALRDPRVNERDWGRFLRSMGYLPLWIALAAGLWLHDRPARGWGWRGGLLLAAPAVSGIGAELVKLLVRRLRPDEATFGYAFRAFSETPLSTGGLGMPSSHVMVAFGGATALARLFPKTWPVGYILAAGCALTRLLTIQHFLSDVVTAAALGWIIGDLVSRWMLRRHHLAVAPV
jgi:membrane-associated phospholipid phosphatase